MAEGSDWRRCATGDAVVTAGGPFGSLRCDAVIHAVGPNYHSLPDGEGDELERGDALLAVRLRFEYGAGQGRAVQDRRLFAAVRGHLSRAAVARHDPRHQRGRRGRRGVRGPRAEDTYAWPSRRPSSASSAAAAGRFERPAPAQLRPRPNAP